MDMEFIYTHKFDREWEEIGLDDDRLRYLELYLQENPQAGKIMQGTGGIRKLRWGLPDKGKSGSIRVLYLYFSTVMKICMFDLFTKDEKDNLSRAEKAALKRIVKTIGEGLRK